MDLFQVPPVDDKIMWDIVLSMFQLATVTVADEINLFHHLGEKNLSVAELAKETDISIRGAESLSGVLMGLNLLKKESGKLALTPFAQTYLLPDSPFYWGIDLEKRRDRQDHQAILTAIRKGGGNPFTEQLGDTWKQGAVSSESARRFTDRMHHMTLAPTLGAVKSGIFDAVTRLLDVGGGSGSLGIAFVEKYPERQAGIFELPAVCEVAKEYIRKYDADANIRIHPGNFCTDPLPSGYDGLCFNSVFHNWPVETCKKLAAAAFEALEPGGQIFLHEMLFDEDKSGPLATAHFDLGMFMKFSAQQFTQDELIHLLSEKGFKEMKIMPTFGYFSMLTARKL